MKKEEKIKKKRLARRKARTRKKLLSKARARLSVFRSNKYIYAQIIDDATGATLVAASEKEASRGKLTKTQKAEAVGKTIAERAQKKKIKKVVFDRGSYKYHGRIKALADAARAGGLEF